mmetsp:Transcript_14289/g.18753  ORF Transcript_14289/g.18753 Transcript_14289/m.18753 type:complete len:480 (+) Transcript_14289:400-1839(+)|eukprot:CAMPEP_0184023726 /NCGR_PEP_ID=MMETSP0954-20121128/11554_1 /TAXON_ID=627963 /ORGANISM="Aplanochytrium sp, Strain PBS07" /LENGTH=479 /DNA_ID=CAMNT_0026306709 /DNA_START=2404 /DNA_END=3843 /DNA_ORIENTATION=+
MAVSIPPVYKGGAETSSFAANALKYLSSRREEKGEVFGGRIVTWGVVFASSFEAVSEVLGDRENIYSVKKAYGLFAGLGLFGNNVMFSDGKEHKKLRDYVSQSDFANEERLETKKHVELINKITDSFTVALKRKISAEEKFTGLRMNTYTTAKNLCTDIIACVFLGFQLKQQVGTSEKCCCEKKRCSCLTVVEGTENFQELQRKFWKATTSTGIKLNVSFFGLNFKSAFAKGEAAKAKIVDILEGIDGRRQSNDCKNATTSESLEESQCSCPFMSSKQDSKDGLSKEERINHYLMFSSSMVAKALASVITSALLQLSQHPDRLEKLRESLSKSEKEDKEAITYLDCVILEVERLYPPIIGCCRFTNKPTVIRGKQVPAGTNVWCSVLTANRDSSKFPDPMKFNPERWSKGNDSVEHFSFGAFDRACLGKPLAKVIVREVVKRIVLNFDWSLEAGQNLNYRWLPVVRPVDGLDIILKSRK